MLHAQTTYTTGGKIGLSVQRWADVSWYDAKANAFGSAPGTPIPMFEAADIFGGSYGLILPDAVTKAWDDGVYSLFFHDLKAGVVIDSYLVEMIGGDDTPLRDRPAKPTPLAFPTLLNGNFEAPVLPIKAYLTASPTGWNFTAGCLHCTGGSAFTVNNPPPPSGMQVVAIQRTGSLSQLVKAWPAGTYAVLLKAAMRGNQGVANDVRITIDGVSVGTFKAADKAYVSFASDPFTVPAGDHILAFLGLNSAGGDNTALIDDVRIGRLS